MVYIFHANTNIARRATAVAPVRAKIKPPRYDKKIGLFATRTPHRPNPIGLSLVKIDKVEDGVLFLSGVDLVHGTPVLDVKPVRAGHPRCTLV